MTPLIKPLSNLGTYVLLFSFFSNLNSIFCILYCLLITIFCGFGIHFFVVCHLIITARYYYFGLRGKCTKQQIESMTLPLLILSRNNLRFLCLYFRYFWSQSYKTYGFVFSNFATIPVISL